MASPEWGLAALLVLLILGDLLYHLRLALLSRRVSRVEKACGLDG